MVKKSKIKVKLNRKELKQLKIFSKAFGKSINWLIEKNLKKDLRFMLCYAKEEDLDVLEHYFKTPIVNKEIMSKIRRE